jgi:hypothetical protein
VKKLGCDFFRICRQGKYEKALEDANLTIEVKPDWGKGYFRRGMALYSLGMFFAVQISTSTGIVQYRYLVAKLYAQQGKNSCLSL